MSRPNRPTRTPAFTTDSAEEFIASVTEDTDTVLAALTGRSPEKARLESVPALTTATLPDPAQPRESPETAPAPTQASVRPAEAADSRSAPATTGEAEVANGGEGRGVGSVTPIGTGARSKTRRFASVGEGRVKPPTAYLSHEVYARLLELSEQERRQKRVTARPQGVIVMDAIEAHAEQLAVTWKTTGAAVPPPGGLFIRTKSNGRYRRHQMAPRSITLQGVSPENAALLKRLKDRWGAGSVSGLVEQALRYEFGM